MWAISSLVIFAASASIVIWYIYAGKYVQDSTVTATKGIFFKTALKLDAYKNISNGNDIWGKFESYSRSDRHDEVLKVYCNDFCKK